MSAMGRPRHGWRNEDACRSILIVSRGRPFLRSQGANAITKHATNESFAGQSLQVVQPFDAILVKPQVRPLEHINVH